MRNPWGRNSFSLRRLFFCTKYDECSIRCCRTLMTYFVSCPGCSTWCLQPSVQCHPLCTTASTNRGLPVTQVQAARLYQGVILWGNRHFPHSSPAHFTEKLMFKNAPTPQEFKEGEDAVIVCDVVSSLPPTIIWKHKGRDVILKKDGEN